MSRRKYSYSRVYITPEEYAEALANGISEKVLNQRVRAYGWDIEKAINTPIKKIGYINKESIKKAKANGIPYQNFTARLRIGWNEKDAYTIPIQTSEGMVKRMNEGRRIYPKEFVELAEKNGISYNTFRRRVLDNKMSYKKAATLPLKYGIKGIKNMEGDTMDKLKNLENEISELETQIYGANDRNKILEQIEEKRHKGYMLLQEVDLDAVE